MSRHFSATLIVTDVEILGATRFAAVRNEQASTRATMLREPDAMSRKWPSIEELRVVVAEKAARSFSLAISPGAQPLARATRAVQ
jgi:hypothetical protein